MPVTLLATSLERKGLPDVTSATQLGQYLAHGTFLAGEYMAYAASAIHGLGSDDLMIFQQDSCLYRTSCTFVPPLNVLVTLKVANPGSWHATYPANDNPSIYTLQFNRAEVVQESLVITATSGHVSTWPAQAWIKMYVDETVPGLTPPSDRLKGNQHIFTATHSVHQYLKMSGAFDSDRPFWKDRNTKMTEFLESQRERKHICTLTNEESVNFTWNDDLATTFNPSQQSSDRLPDQLNGWTVFRNWKLLDGEDLIVNENEVQDLEIQEAGIYELHFNVFFYASLFNYADAVGNNHFATREALDVAVSEFLHSNQNNRNAAAAHYGPIEDWEFSNTIVSFDGLFEDYTLLSDNALDQISLKWDVSNITVFTDMFKGDKKYGISAVLAINNAWGTSNPSNWSQTTAVLKTAPFETRDQLMEAIYGAGAAPSYPTSSAVYGTIDSWEFASSLTDFSNLFDADTSHSNSSFNANISSWNVSSVTDMSSMFNGCSSFNQDISNWNVSSVQNMSSMFKGCTTFRQSLTDWDVSSVLSSGFSAMFEGTGYWPQDNYSTASGDSYMLYTWSPSWYSRNSNWSPTEANMQVLFYKRETSNADDTSLLQAVEEYFTDRTTAIGGYGNIKDWNFANSSIYYGSLGYLSSPTSLIDMSNLFDGKDVGDIDISAWDVSGVHNMSGMFKDTTNWASMSTNIGSWDVSSVYNMSHMFNGCSSFNQDISDWVVSSVTNMSSMFNGCSSFNQDIKTVNQYWVVSSVQDMSSMFNGCSSFNQDISNWDVSGIGDTAAEATELYSIDYQVPASTDELRNPGSSPPSGYKTEYLLHNHSDNNGYWNIVNPQLTVGQSTWTFSNAVLTAPNLKDGLTNPKLISDIDFTINDVDVAYRKYYRSYSAIQEHQQNNLYSVGSDILFLKPYHIISSQYPNGNSANAATAGYDYNLPIQFKFTNLPRGSYKLRIFSQLTNNGQNVPNYTVYTLTASGQNETTDNGNSSVAYVTFDNLDFTTNSNELGWSAHYNTNNSSHKSTVFGGVQLQRNYYVSKFKDMFKNSAWASASDTVKDQINDAWTAHNVRWYKNEAKLF